jgi:hypothetical protein
MLNGVKGRSFDAYLFICLYLQYVIMMISYLLACWHVCVLSHLSVIHSHLHSYLELRQLCHEEATALEVVCCLAWWVASTNKANVVESVEDPNTTRAS